MIETSKVQAQTQNQWGRDGAYNMHGPIAFNFFGFHITLGRKNTDWRDVRAGKNVRLNDGSYGDGLVMRRTVNGKYEYRKMTDNEVSAFHMRTAW